MIFLSNVHVKPLNQSCRNVDQDPDKVIVKAIFLKSHNNCSIFFKKEHLKVKSK